MKCPSHYYMLAFKKIKKNQVETDSNVKIETI